MGMICACQLDRDDNSGFVLIQLASQTTAYFMTTAEEDDLGEEA